MKELCKSLGVWLGNDTKILCVDELLFSAANIYVSIGFCSLHLQVICKRSKDMEMKWWDVLETRCLDLPGTLRWVSALRFAVHGSIRLHRVTASLPYAVAPGWDVRLFPGSDHRQRFCCEVVTKVRYLVVFFDRYWYFHDGKFIRIDLQGKIYEQFLKRHGRLHQPSHSVSLWAIYTPEITRIRFLVSWFLPARGTSREVHSDT